ncbi:MAG: DNA/RNA non-specific endonuclease [Bacteroidota bacterium]
MTTPHYFYVLLLLALPYWAQAQSERENLRLVEVQIQELEAEQLLLEARAEELKLHYIREDLRNSGLPTADFLEHSAFFFAYSEAHEQAQWVAHIILPDIISGTQFRSNDFREDPLVASGTAVEADYFLKYLQADSSYTYDGYGFDRGHLAPSADFRWSAKALSESYFYSNMAPQRPEFNREGWAELEGLLRGYIFDHPSTQLYVVTGGVLKDGLPQVERSPNSLTIPEQYYKVALDLQAGQAIGFLMPNAALEYPLEHYALPVDEIEAITGLDFFKLIEGEEAIEAQLDKAHWFPELAQGDVEPVYPPLLPRGHYNSVQARQQARTGRAVTVVGQVVSSRYSRSGNLWMNIDKQFPNQIFSVFIKKEDLVNFSGDPQDLFDGRVIAVKGRVREINGVPTINIDKEEQIWWYEGGTIR